jgi:hypothetical protein
MGFGIHHVNALPLRDSVTSLWDLFSTPRNKDRFFGAPVKCGTNQRAPTARVCEGNFYLWMVWVVVYFREALRAKAWLFPNFPFDRQQVKPPTFAAVDIFADAKAVKALRNGNPG